MLAHVLPALASPTARGLPSKTLISLAAFPLVARLLMSATTAIRPETHSRASPAITMMFMKNMVLVTSAGKHIEVKQHRLAPTATEIQQQIITSHTNVYLPVELGGAADWGKEVPGAEFHVLSRDYLATFPELDHAFRLVRIQDA